MKVAVAMSGGVDSSVAAAILKGQGHQVIGVTMLLPGTAGVGPARAAADRLGIEHHVIDLKEAFETRVIADFIHEYSRGRTPNPCVRCNRYVKFGALLEEAHRLGADLLATGHYARVESEQGRYVLKSGVDRRKDQSYVLYSLTQEQLGQVMLPLGGLTKQDVREMAQEAGLNVAVPESQDACFIPGGDYPGFLGARLPLAARPGPILNAHGAVLGEHPGIAFYTVGQRRRLGISSSRPLYVTAIDPGRNAVIVGEIEEAYSRGLVASSPSWIAGGGLNEPIQVTAKIRYRHTGVAALGSPAADGRVEVRFSQAQFAVTPGQSVVFFEGDIVLGGGVIERAIV